MPAKLGDIRVCKWSETAIDPLLTTSNTQTFMFSAGLHFNTNELALKRVELLQRNFFARIKRKQIVCHEVQNIPQTIIN